MRDDSYGGPESVVRLRAKRNGCEVSLYLSRLSDIQSRYRVEGDRGWAEGGEFDWKRVRIGDASGDEDPQAGLPGCATIRALSPRCDNFLA